jgi:hypothetical protein
MLLNKLGGSYMYRIEGDITEKVKLGTFRG